MTETPSPYLVAMAASLPPTLAALLITYSATAAGRKFVGDLVAVAQLGPEKAKEAAAEARRKAEELAAKAREQRHQRAVELAQAGRPEIRTTVEAPTFEAPQITNAPIFENRPTFNPPPLPTPPATRSRPPPSSSPPAASPPPPRSGPPPGWSRGMSGGGGAQFRNTIWSHDAANVALGVHVIPETPESVVHAYLRRHPLDKQGAVYYDPDRTTWVTHPGNVEGLISLGGGWYAIPDSWRDVTLSPEARRRALRAEPGRFGFPHGTTANELFANAHEARQAGWTWTEIDAAMNGNEPRDAILKEVGRRSGVGDALKDAPKCVKPVTRFPWLIPSTKACADAAFDFLGRTSVIVAETTAVAIHEMIIGMLELPEVGRHSVRAYVRGALVQAGVSPTRATWLSRLVTVPLAPVTRGLDMVAAVSRESRKKPVGEILDDVAREVTGMSDDEIQEWIDRGGRF